MQKVRKGSSPLVARSERKGLGFVMGTASVSLRSSDYPGAALCFLVNRNLGSGLVETRTSGEAHNAKR